MLRTLATWPFDRRRWSPSGLAVPIAELNGAMAEIGLEMRAVVVIAPGTSERELADLHKAGARGVRMIAGERGVIPFSDLETIAHRIREMGWHIEFLIWPEHIVELETRIDRMPCPFVIDHLAFIDVQLSSIVRAVDTRLNDHRPLKAERLEEMPR